MMKNKRRLLFCIAAVIVLIAIAACMFVIGRGHTIYFDNKTTEYEGTEYSTFHRVEITVNGERVAKLSKKERGMATCMGQKFTFSLEVTANKGDDPVAYTFTLDLPYSMDGIVINLPAYLAELPQDAWLSEFIAAPTEEETEDDGTVTDEFDIGAEF